MTFEPIALEELRKPNPARIYDYYLGGKEARKYDEEFAAKLDEVRPDIRVTVVENRRFLRRVVRYLVTECGVRQFLDIGSGLPTRNNVHEEAQSLDEACRVVYVDNDRVAAAHAEALLAHERPGVGVVLGDLREPDTIFNAAAVRELIDWNEPAAVLMVAVLHFIRDDDHPHDAVARYIDKLPAGGYLAMSHALDVPGTAEIEKLYGDLSTSTAQARSETEIGRFFTGLDLIDPGLVRVDAWRPIARSVKPTTTVTAEKDGKAGKQDAGGTDGTDGGADAEVWWLGGLGVKAP